MGKTDRDEAKLFKPFNRDCVPFHTMPFKKAGKGFSLHGRAQSKNAIPNMYASENIAMVHI